MRLVLFNFILLFVFSFGQGNAQKLKKVWECSEGLKVPESVIYDEQRDVIYVANINGNSSEKDGNGFISVLNSDGTLKELQWIKKLNAPKGMAIYKGKLFVSDIDHLVEIDIEKGKVVNKYSAPEAVFLNDVTACLKGMIFVSDSRAAKIYVLQQGEFKVWFEGEPLKRPNGLLAEKGKLLVGDLNIYEIDILTQKVETLVENVGGVDGLEKDEDGNFIYSNWGGRIFNVLNGQKIKLHDSTESKINTADIDYVLKSQLILVPTFFNNRVVAYKIVQ